MESSEVRGVTLVCFAVKEEAAPFLKFAKGDASISVLVTGMGRKNTESSVQTFLSAKKPALVLTCGFAGALNSELEIGAVLFDADPESGLIEWLQSAGASPAKLHCSARVATTAGEKAALRQSTGADAVEMESAAIREICREKRIPAATIRVISDTARQDLPLDFNALMTADQNLSVSKLALALVKSPGKIPKLMELQRNTRFAAQKLTEVLEKLLSRRDAGRGRIG